MYSWMWRKLPYGRPGKIAGLTLAIGGLIGLLWYGAFPIVDHHLPNNNVQVTQPDSNLIVPPAPTDTPSPTPSHAHSRSGLPK